MEKPIYYAGIAEKYYNLACPSYAQNGYDKNVLLDIQTEKCIFVSGDVKPGENELLFRCKRSGGETLTTLKTPHQPKSNNHSNWTENKTYAADIHPTTWDNGKEATFAYIPDAIYNQFPKTVKVANLDTFLCKCMEIDAYECNPYEILEIVDSLSTVNSPFGVPTEYVRIPITHNELNGELVFHILYFEKLETGIVATFEFTGIEYEDQPTPDTDEF